MIVSQVTIRHKVVHVPLFVEVEQIEYVDVIKDPPVETVREQIVEVPKVTTFVICYSTSQ